MRVLFGLFFILQLLPITFTERNSCCINYTSPDLAVVIDGNACLLNPLIREEKKF
jgi:hypothetical protein